MNITLIDCGCGEGWILRLLRKNNIQINYIGIDFNEKIISQLQIRHFTDKNAKFIVVDLETKIPKELIGKADIVLNFFNLFEIPKIDNAIKNLNKMVKVNGDILIATIDPIMQIMAISENYSDFKRNLKYYEKHNFEIGYDKDIDTGGRKSGKIYKGILYSSANYISMGLKDKLKIVDYKEVIKTGNKIPQIYQFIYFKK